MEILYIGYLFPRDEYYTNKAMSFAAGRFEMGLIEGLAKTEDVTVKTLSVEPRLGKYPKDKLWVKGRKLEIIDGVTSKSIGYINFPFLKHACLWTGMIFQIRKWEKRTRGKPRAIMSYNADAPIIQVGLHFQKHGITYAPLIADIPFYDEVKKGHKSIKELLSQIGYRSQYKNLPKLHNAIVLNENVGRDFGIPNTLLVEGAVTEDEIKQDCSSQKKDGKNILYCGSLDVFHGADKLLQLVKQCPTYTFNICGRGSEWSQKFSDASKELSNLRFHGAVDDCTLRELQSNANLLIIPHPVCLKQLRYQFPSKLMTCMSTGIPVILTPLPGIPDEYKQYVDITEDDSVECLKEHIHSFFLKEDDEKKRMGKDARKFVIENKTWDIQSRRIVSFFSEEC